MKSKLLEPIKIEINEAELEDMFTDYLDETYGEVDVCGDIFTSSYALRKLDPCSYNYALFNFISRYCDENEEWECPICGDIYNDAEDAKYCCQDIDDE